MSVFSVLLYMSMLGIVVQGSRILLYPYPYYSHVEESLSIGSALLTRGHSVYVILPPSYPGLEKVEARGVKVITYVMREGDDWRDMNQEAVDDLRRTMHNMSPVEEFRTNVIFVTHFCDNALSDKQLYRRVRDLNIDLAVIDTTASSRCNLILLYRLGIPYVAHANTDDPWLLRSPALPSFVPWSMSVFDSARYMDFWQRLMNAWSVVDWSISTRLPSADDALVSTYAPEMPFISLNDLARRSLVWLIVSDFAIDYPRPLMPNEVNIGGLMTGASKPVSEEYEDFLNCSEKDAVLVSFGSTDWSTQDMYNKMMSVFARLDHLMFVWRYTFPFPAEVPGHIKLVKWIPQNDLLGHPRVKLFITHGGANGQFEALYHGKPMIVFPVTADQPFNAMRAQDMGVAIKMNTKAFTEEELERNILKVIPENSTYTRKIRQRSTIFRSQPLHPRDRAVYWIEHVLQFGGEHLRSAALDMPWYQYLMLDILLFVLGAIFVKIVVIYRLIQISCYKISHYPKWLWGSLKRKVD